MSENVAAYPNPLSPDQDKNTPEFGLKVMKSCYGKWRNGYGSESWAVRKKRFDYNRAFAMGKQPMNEYKDILNVDGQLSVVNIDYTPLPIAIPFLNRLKDRYLQRIEKIQCNAIDPFTYKKKQDAKDKALFKLKEKEKIQAIQQFSGVQLEEFSEDDPENDKELEIQFGFNYKEREEVIMENLIDIVFYDNQWSSVIKERILDDLINCGYSVTKTYMDGNGRIKIKWVKPENFVTSYSEWSDMRDWEWNGEVFYMSIAEIRLKYPGKISEQKLFDLARRMQGKFGNGDWTYNWDYTYTNAIARPYDSFRVQVIDLCYKTLYNLKYEKNTDRFGKEILDKATKIKPNKEYEQSKPYYVSYTGVWIVDTDYVLEWQLSKNMIKPQSNLTEIYSPYTVFMYNNNQMVNTPMIETMIPSIKMMQLIHLQTQKLIASVAPDGYDIDVSGLSDIDLGEGVGVVSPMQLFGIYLQTGVRYYKSVEDGDENGTSTRRPPIQQNYTQYSNKLEQLENQWQKEYQKLLTYVGSNSLDQGLISNQAVGKQVLENARQIGESASNYLYNAYLSLMEGTAKRVQLRGWDILVFKKGGYDGYRYALGTDKIEYINVEASDDFEKTNFDIKIQAVVDDNEAQFLEQNIQASLNNGIIELEDAIDVRNLAKMNIKYASYMLASRTRKRKKDKMREAMANSQANTEQAIAAAQAKTEGDIQLVQAKAQFDSQGKQEELETQKEIEISKFASILKTKVVEGMLNQGKTIEDIQQVAPWVFEGVGVISKSQKQIMLEDMEEHMQQAEQMQQVEQQPEMEEESSESME